MTAPILTKDEARIILDSHRVYEKVSVLGIRGYFAPEDGNKRGIYDDALFIIAPNFFKGYNANTDPSVDRPGIAVLQPGTYQYIKGLHGVSGTHPYYALRQYSDVTVLRDGKTIPETDSTATRFWIDIHRGGYNTTSSLGCQTIHPDQWDNFRDNIFEQMQENAQKVVPYLLVLK